MPYNKKILRYLMILALPFLIFQCNSRGPVIGPYPSRGLASWYNPRITASGERHFQDELTCAMRKRGFGKYYLVCNPDNNKCVEVKHNDFGPSRGMYGRGRIIDLSKLAFSKIADLDKGLIRVRIGEIHYEKVD